jgi:hypothetical protein
MGGLIWMASRCFLRYQFPLWNTLSSDSDLEVMHGMAMAYLMPGWHILQGCLIFLGDYFTPLFLAHILRLLAAFRSFTAPTWATYTHFHEDILYGVTMHMNVFLPSCTEAVMARCFWRIHVLEDWEGRADFAMSNTQCYYFTYNLCSMSQCAIN